MRAAVLESVNNIVCKEIPTPIPDEGEVRIRVSYTGVCGSDIPRALSGRVHSFPLVLGHEFSGVVDHVGDGVPDELVGKRVVGVPLEPCRECPNCKSGYYSLCTNYGFIGSRSFGSMAEYVVVPQKNIIQINDEVTDIEAAFFEPASVAVHGIELAGVRPGMSAIILGGGTIGIFLAQALRDYGISDIVVTNRTEKKLAAICAAGIKNTVATINENWQDEARRMGSCSGFDVVFDTAGTPETILDAFDMASPRASVCIVGTPKRNVQFTVSQWEQLNRKELTVRGTWMSYSAPWPGIEWTKVRNLFASGTLKIVDEMIDKIYPLDRAQEALQRFAISDSVHGKILINSKGE